MKNGLLKIGVVFAVIFSYAIAAYCVDDARSYEAILEKYKDVACNAGLKPVGTPAKKTCVIENPLSLKKAVALGLKNNPEVLMAAARIKRASAMLKRAESAFYPYVEIYTEYVQGDAPSAFLFKSIDQRKLPEGTDFNHPGWFENFESGVKAGINLYNGGKDRLKHDMAELDLELSRLDQKGINNRITEMVIRAFYDALAGKKFITVATESVETVRSQLRIMEVRFKSGGALKSDILSLKVRAAASEEALVRSKNQYWIAIAALAEILGLEPDIDLNLRENTQEAAVVVEDVVTATKSAIKNRPELKSIRKKLIQSEMAVERARDGYLPRIDIMTRYYHDDPNMQYNANRENWTAGIYASWDLFSGFSTKNEVKSAVTNVHEMLAKDRQVLLAIKFDVKKAYLNYHEAKERLKVAKSGVVMAKETLKLVKRQYEGGSADITRYLEAYVREGLITKGLPGSKLKVFIETLGKTVDALVEEIVPYADPSSRTFLVKASIPHIDGLYPGMFGKLLIPVKKRNVVVVPHAAVRQVGQLELLFIKENKKWSSVYVKTGARIGQDVEILSGLNGGETIGWEIRENE